MQAAIDVGTNTVRVLLGHVQDGRMVPHRYYREITRLGGGATAEKGLAPSARERTLFALAKIAAMLAEAGVTQFRAVGTEALRRAPNGLDFASEVRSKTGIPLEIIDGVEEARLSALGVLSALEPTPEKCLIFDIGGGSTEFILCHQEKLLFQASYPLGVVTLCENWPQESLQARYISEILSRLEMDLCQAGADKIVSSQECRIVGTAGTITTLAALKLQMTTYDGQAVNNLILSEEDLVPLLRRLTALSPPQREGLAGMEKGRGDLIVPGLRSVLAILARFHRKELVVIDSGLLEGILLSAVGQQCESIDSP